MYKTLVISGGGTYGIEILGALQRALDTGFLQPQNLSLIVGTSVGSIIGYLVAIGYAPLEILVRLVRHTNVLGTEMLKGAGSQGVVPIGLLQFAPMRRLLEHMTLERAGTMHTLESLKAQTGIELVCVAYNYTLRKTVYIDSTAFPDMPCLQALEMSSAIPFVFPPCVYGGHTFVDGCIGDKFPVGEAIDRTLPSTGVFGVCVSARHEPPPCSPKPSPAPPFFGNLWGFDACREAVQSARSLVLYGVSLFRAIIDNAADMNVRHVQRLSTQRDICLSVVSIVPTHDIPIWNIDGLSQTSTVLDKFSTGYSHSHV